MGRLKRNLVRSLWPAILLSCSAALAADTAAKGPLSLFDRVAVADASMEHPVVAAVRQAGYMSIESRERALSARMPAHLAWAVADAPGRQGIMRYQVDLFVTRALRSRHTLGPSGALRKEPVSISALSARESFLLGWVRALSASSPSKLRGNGRFLRDAGAEQLLVQAVALGPLEQAHHLALALVQAARSPTRQSGACQAWQQVQRAARDGRKSSVRLAVAESAIAAVKRQGRACTARQRRVFKGKPSLPLPPTEQSAKTDPSESDVDAAQLLAAHVRKELPFVVLAPIFRGYLDVPMVRQIATRGRPDAAAFDELMRADRTGDATIAALNATVLMRRLSPLASLQAVWQAISGRHRASRGDPRRLLISMLTGPQAVVLGYAKAMVGDGLRASSAKGELAAISATPRRLFAHGRKMVAADASLGPLMAMGHSIDIERIGTPCAALKRTEAMVFVIRKSSLSKSSKEALQSALHGVQEQCRLVRDSSSGKTGNRAGERSR